MAKYNRSQARQYARRHASTVCHDGTVACELAGKTTFRDFSVGTRIQGRPIAGENDCSHFVSCCLGNHGGKFHGKQTGVAGGGVPIPAEFYAKAYGILGAPNLVKHLKRGYATLIGKEKMPSAQAKGLIKELEMGDVIAYAASAKGGYRHMAVHLWKGRIACHTSSRLDRMWNTVSHGFITLLHITF